MQCPVHHPFKRPNPRRKPSARNQLIQRAALHLFALPGYSKPVANASPAVHPDLYPNGVTTMSKSKDTKKSVKKEPAKTPKEKKEAKKVKKEERKRQ